ncbi:MAG: pitrilysin family protein [Bdellovibrionales bacterium]
MKKLLLLVCVLGFLLPATAHAVDIQEVKGPKSGVKAWLVEDHRLPIIALQFAFQGGVEQDPSDKQGLAALTVAALTEGAGEYSSAAFQQQMADRSISIGFSVERDEINGGLKCLAADKEKAFELLRLALTAPRFEESAISRLRAQHLSGIRRLFSDPSWQARHALLSEIFANHPYSQRRLGTTQTLQTITRDDVRNFAAQHFARDTLTVAAAGAITADELSSALDAIFSDLPARAKLKRVADVTYPHKTPTILVKRDGTQTQILFAMPGPKRSDPDYYAAQIANYVLGGGGFASRLMQEVRDARGLTYGISTYVAPSQHAALVIGSAAVDNPKAGEAFSVIRETMRRVYEEGLTARDIAAAKDYLTGSMPLALTSTNKIAGFLVTMQRENLGRDYLDRYDNIIRSVTESDITRALERFFNPDRMTLVVVGNPKGIVPTQTKETVKQ